MKTKQVKAVVVFEKYEGYGGRQALLRKTYQGDRLGVLVAIANAHSYGCDEGETEEIILQRLLEQNGDGCDYIISFQIDGKDVPGFEIENDE